MSICTSICKLCILHDDIRIHYAHDNMNVYIHVKVIRKLLCMFSGLLTSYSFLKLIVNYAFLNYLKYHAIIAEETATTPSTATGIYFLGGWNNTYTKHTALYIYRSINKSLTMYTNLSSTSSYLTLWKEHHLTIKTA